MTSCKLCLLLLITSLARVCHAQGSPNRLCCFYSPCYYLSSIGNAFPGESLAGASERHLQALISKKKRSGPHAQPGLNTAFRAVQDAVVRRCRVHMMFLHMSSTPSHLEFAPFDALIILLFDWECSGLRLWSEYRAFQQPTGLVDHQAPVAPQQRQIGMRQMPTVNTSVRHSRCKPVNMYFGVKISSMSST